MLRLLATMAEAMLEKERTDVEAEALFDLGSFQVQPTINCKHVESHVDDLSSSMDPEHYFNGLYSVIVYPVSCTSLCMASLYIIEHRH